MLRNALITLSVLFTLTAVGCGGSDSSSPLEEVVGDGSGAGLGQVTLTASGAVTGQFSGMMDFHYMEIDDFGVDGASWELSGNDGGDGNQSFSLTLSIESFINSGAGIGRPEVGSYVIGSEDNSTDVFSAVFTYIGAGGFADTTEYESTMTTYTGTLTITESSADTVRGTFVADLFWEDFCTIDGCVGDSINITGDFTAQDRIF